MTVLRMLAIAAVLLLAPGLVMAQPARSFYAVYARDAGATADWYAGVFGLETVNRFDRPTFDQRILSGERLFIEVIQLKPAPPARLEKQLGYGKAGLVVDDFDAKVARWRAEGVRFFGSGRVFWDGALGLHGVQLLDPDDNIVQVYGLSASAPRS